MQKEVIGGLIAVLVVLGVLGWLVATAPPSNQPKPEDTALALLAAEEIRYEKKSINSVDSFVLHHHPDNIDHLSA